MSPLERIRSGLIVTALAILVPWGTTHWLETRVFRPLDIPVSLETGKIHAAEFETNFRETYRVDFDIDYLLSVQAQKDCHAFPERDVHWTLYRLNRGTLNQKALWASNRNPAAGEWTFGFQGPSGRYRLEWDVDAGATCLNALHPRVTISTPVYDYEEINGLIQYLAFFLATAGAMLALRGLVGWLRGLLVGTARPLRMLPELRLEHVLPARPRSRIGPMAPMPHLSNFSMAWTGLLSVLIFVNIVMNPFLNPPIPRGLFLKIHEPSAAAGQKSPWLKTMSVYVGADDRFYVNSKAVAADELRARLREELGKQMVWTVYFEADEASTFAKAAYAFGEIQAAGAKVIWITPQVRQELNQQERKRGAP